MYYNKSFKKMSKDYTSYPGLMRMNQTNFDVQLKTGAVKLKKVGY